MQVRRSYYAEQLVKASLMDSENGEKFEMIKILLTRDF